MLVVLDDDEMYLQQQPLSLGQARAVATSLNRCGFTHTHTHTCTCTQTRRSAPPPPSPLLLLPLPSLVYHTYLPKLAGGSAHSGASTGMEGAPPLLADYAPLLLRSLYERDVRWVPGVSGLGGFGAQGAWEEG